MNEIIAQNNVYYTYDLSRGDGMYSMEKCMELMTALAAETHPSTSIRIGCQKMQLEAIDSLDMRLFRDFLENFTKCLAMKRSKSAKVM